MGPHRGLFSLAKSRREGLIPTNLMISAREICAMFVCALITHSTSTASSGIASGTGCDFLDRYGTKTMATKRGLEQLA